MPQSKNISSIEDVQFTSQANSETGKRFAKVKVSQSQNQRCPAKKREIKKEMKDKMAAPTEQRERIKRGRKKENLEDCILSAEQREGFYKSELIHFGFYDEEGQSLKKPSELNKEEIELRHKLNSWINAKNQRKQIKEIEIGGTVNAEV